MKKIFVFLFLFLISFPIKISADNINSWSASWITVPGATTDGYGVYCFRKQFSLKTLPDKYIVCVSGDNRYKLYINGDFVSAGPARSDLSHWNYETVDLSPYLKIGDNMVSAVVWNDGKLRPIANISYRTGFILQGASSLSSVINTDKSWQCVMDSGYTPLPVVFPNYYVAGPGEVVDMHKHIDVFNDKGWMSAVEIMRGVCKGLSGMASPEGWMLQPSPIPLREMHEERLVSVRRITGGISANDKFLAGKCPLVIPAHTSTEIILDQKYLTNAYFNMSLSGGDNSNIIVGYQESLFNKYPSKGNRNDIDGKVFIGRKDEIVSNGTANQLFSTLAWRTYRYVVINVKTENQPLTINDIYGVYTGYPHILKASLETNNKEIKRIFDIGWRTLRLCTNETYMDCPYYEQLQYFGDTRIQALATLYNTGDDRLVKNFLTQADLSRQPEGVTLSRYPATDKQIITPYSLSYVGALYDYMMYGNDSLFVKSKLMGIRMILDYFHKYQKEDGSLVNLPWWNFTDWVDSPNWVSGVAELGKDGCSALLDLQLLYAYEEACALESEFGMSAFANIYQQQIDKLKTTIKNKYWNSSRGLLADRAEQDHYSQHVNALGIITGVINDAEACEVGNKLIKDKTLAQASIYFRYFLHQALAKIGLGNSYLDWLDKWRENINMGLTTWAETSDVDNTRSDCHAWGASPNIELFRIVLGIDTEAPCFRKILVAPHLGQIKRIGGEMPSPYGMIKVNYKCKGSSIHARINIPESVSGEFVWNGKRYPIHGGFNEMNVK